MDAITLAQLLSTEPEVAGEQNPGGGSAPSGFAYITDGAGNRLTDGAGNLLIVPIEE